MLVPARVIDNCTGTLATLFDAPVSERFFVDKVWVTLFAVKIARSTGIFHPVVPMEWYPIFCVYLRKLGLKNASFSRKQLSLDSPLSTTYTLGRVFDALQSTDAPHRTLSFFPKPLDTNLCRKYYEGTGMARRAENFDNVNETA